MRHFPAAFIVFCAASSTAWCDGTVVENGITYQETRRVEKTPTTNVHLEERTETVYRTETVTEFRDEVRTVWVPVTSYTYQPRWQNPANLFGTATPSYELRPNVRWELRTQKVSVPVTTQRVVPETRIVEVPVRSLGFVEREVIERVAVRTPTTSQLAPATVAQRPSRPTAVSLSPTTGRLPVNQPIMRR